METAVGQRDGRLHQRQREARHAVAEVRDVGALGGVDARLDLVAVEVNTGLSEQAAEPLAAVAIASLVVPQRVVAVERDEVECQFVPTFGVTPRLCMRNA
jgi:hypothetical protein